MNCLNCQKETNNPKFCSRSCAASFTNKLAPKRKPTHFCKSCGEKINSRSYYCSSCKPQSPCEDTLKDVIYTQHHRSSAFALVRSRARTTIRKENITSCMKCGYNKHIEVCHIKPIGSFPLETKLSVINSLDNLLVLCPNCHWELDNLSLSIER